ncbi:hypothetical protein BGX26_011415 [Mortierella sp. AD094]|nr:hypothetical protein BGX26_011415 [Mortierella sp. AD094]
MGLRAVKESLQLLQREVLEAQKHIFAEQKAIFKGMEELFKEEEELAKAKMQFEVGVARFGKSREVIITVVCVLQHGGDLQAHMPLELLFVLFRRLYHFLQLLPLARPAALLGLENTHWKVIWIHVSSSPDFHNNLIHQHPFGISVQEIA